MKQSITVKLKLGQKYGNTETTLLHITEIHYLYPSKVGDRIAFESDIDGTGYTYGVEDVLEFEALLEEK